MIVFREADADLARLADRTVAVIGYGNQGRAHALNLRDSGVRVVVGIQPGRPSWRRAEEDGFVPRPIRDAVCEGGVVVMLLPDEHQAEVYATDVEPALGAGAALLFAHGFTLRFGLIRPPAAVDVLLVAPVGPGVELRARYVAGGGIPAYVAVSHDATGSAWPLCLAYAKALGCLRVAAFETTVTAEAEVDLFGEQAVLCGGVSALLVAAFDVLVEAGYDPEMAYLECVHQVALLANLVRTGGIDGMRRNISQTALFGDLTRGPRIVGAASRTAMREVLAEVRDGRFAAEWLAPGARERLAALLAESASRAIEQVGAHVRGLVGSQTAQPGAGGQVRQAGELLLTPTDAADRIRVE